MANLVTTKNFKDQNIKNNVLTFNGEEKAEGFDSIQFEQDDDRNTVSKVADGMGVFSVNPSTSGVFTVVLHKASATNTYLWNNVATKENQSVSISWKNTAMPDFSITTAYAKLVKPPVMLEQLENEPIEWMF